MLEKWAWVDSQWIVTKIDQSYVGSSAANSLRGNLH